MKDLEKIVAAIESEWLESGFLWKLRDGEFDIDGYTRLKKQLIAINQQDDRVESYINRDLVKLVWFIPQFMEWQIDRVVQAGSDPSIISHACSEMREIVGQILGEP